MTTFTCITDLTLYIVHYGQVHNVHCVHEHNTPSLYEQLVQNNIVYSTLNYELQTLTVYHEPSFMAYFSFPLSFISHI